MNTSREATEPARHLTVVPTAPAGMCAEHPAYEADYCPVCGTARVIGS